MLAEGKSVARISTDDKSALPHILEKLSDEDFVRTLYEHILGRHPSPTELHGAASQLRSGCVSRHGLMTQHLANRVAEETAWATSKNDINASHFGIMGTGVVMTAKEWQVRAAAPSASPVTRPHARFPMRPRTSDVDVSVICNLWRGGDFIERYLDNITSQNIFADRCELIVVDAASPEGEGEVVARYAKRFGHRIVYHRMPYRAGIYTAWNVGVGLARGRLPDQRKSRRSQARRFPRFAERNP